MLLVELMDRDAGTQPRGLLCLSHECFVLCIMGDDPRDLSEGRSLNGPQLEIGWQLMLGPGGLSEH